MKRGWNESFKLQIRVESHSWLPTAAHATYTGLSSNFVIWSSTDIASYPQENEGKKSRLFLDNQLKILCINILIKEILCIDDIIFELAMLKLYIEIFQIFLSLMNDNS